MQDFSLPPTVQRSLVKRFRKELWQPFVAACKRYSLVPEGAKVAVCLDGTTPALLASLLLEELHQHSDVPFDLTVVETSSTTRFAGGPPSPEGEGNDGRTCKAPVSPERGDVAAAKERFRHTALARGCDRYVIPDCLSDLTETVLTAMLCEGETRAFLPQEKPDANGLIAIRPLYCIEEKAIRAFCRYNGLPYVPRETDPKRRLARNLLESVKRDDPDAEIRVFHAIHAVHADTFPKRG